MTARILVVDDTEANARILSLAVMQDYYDVRTVSNGMDALETAVNWRPDVIILDVMMPAMDGYEVCRQLKRSPRTAQIPIVMVTALDGAAAKLRGLECGADDFLTRPIDYETMLARIRSLVRLKRLSDEWQARWETTNVLGLIEGRPRAVELAGATVLLVDDWDLGADRIRAMLEEEGVICRQASSEEEALRAIQRDGFDLVIVNLSMGTDPLRLASRLRAADPGRDLPLLLVTESDHRDIILRGFDLGANDWIMRPIDINELRVRARNQIRRKLYQDRLRSDVDQAMRLALVDPLTGLYNRRYFQRHLESQLAARPFVDVALMMIDIDMFKQFNDRFGHPAGDRALTQVAGLLRRETRIVDLVARLGGEEFVVVIVGMTGEEVAGVAERLRRAVADLALDCGKEPSVGLTISIGVAAAKTATSAATIIEHADAALYRAKTTGRNQVVFAG